MQHTLIFLFFSNGSEFEPRSIAIIQLWEAFDSVGTSRGYQLRAMNGWVCGGCGSLQGTREPAPPMASEPPLTGPFRRCRHGIMTTVQCNVTINLHRWRCANANIDDDAPQGCGCATLCGCATSMSCDDARAAESPNGDEKIDPLC